MKIHPKMVIKIGDIFEYRVIRFEIVRIDEKNYYYRFIENSDVLEYGYTKDNFIRRIMNNHFIKIS